MHMGQKINSRVTDNHYVVARTPIIRKINLNDPEDIRRVAVIDRNREVLKYMAGKELNEKELLEFVTDDENRTLYVVSGHKGVPKEEIGKLQGWILIYSGKEVTERERRALGRKVFDLNFSIIEVSYAKYPTAFPGQIADGLRQVLLDLARKSGGDLRKGLMPPILVTAYVSPENEQSRHVLETAGFTLQPKKIIWDSKESKKKDLVYVLDWNRLHCSKKMQKSKLE